MYFLDERTRPKKLSNVCPFSQVVAAELPYSDFSLVPLQGKSHKIFLNLKVLVFPIKINFSIISNVGYCIWRNKVQFHKVLYLGVNYPFSESHFMLYYRFMIWLCPQASELGKEMKCSTYRRANKGLVRLVEINLRFLRNRLMRSEETNQLRFLVFS